jgi:hypothetical protein
MRNVLVRKAERRGGAMPRSRAGVDPRGGRGRYRANPEICRILKAHHQTAQTLTGYNAAQNFERWQLLLDGPEVGRPSTLFSLLPQSHFFIARNSFRSSGLRLACCLVQDLPRLSVSTRTSICTRRYLERQSIGSRCSTAHWLVHTRDDYQDREYNLRTCHEISHPDA